MSATPVHAPSTLRSAAASVTRPFRWLLLVAARRRRGHASGASPSASARSTNLSDGYPWGIWIAFDVVVGTALGCGGYAVALLVYILNKGEYHPLVRPAVLDQPARLRPGGARRHRRPRPLLGPLEDPDLLLAAGATRRSSRSRSASWPTSSCCSIELSPALFEKLACRAPTPALRSVRRARPCASSTRRWRLDHRPRPAAADHAPVLARHDDAARRPEPPRALVHALAAVPVPPLLPDHGLRHRGLRGPFAARAFGRPRETAMLGRLAKVAMWVALLLRRLPARRRGARRRARPARLACSAPSSSAELAMHLAAARRPAVAPRGAPIRSGRCGAGILLILARHRLTASTPISSAFNPGAHWQLLPGGARAADHLRHRRRRARHLHLGRQDLPDPRRPQPPPRPADPRRHES